MIIHYQREKKSHSLRVDSETILQKSNTCKLTSKRPGTVLMWQLTTAQESGDELWFEVAKKQLIASLCYMLLNRDLQTENVW